MVKEQKIAICSNCGNTQAFRSIRIGSALIGLDSIALCCNAPEYLTFKRIRSWKVGKVK